VFLGVGKEEKVPDIDMRGPLSATVTHWKALSDTIFTSHQELLDSVLIRDGLVFMI
jgi:hypothetical protein